MQRRDLEGLTREELIARAERLGVSRPRVLTQLELMDEILARTAKSGKKPRGWLARARDLLTSVVERGLHVPDATRKTRSAGAPAMPSAPPPLPTVTLAEIYAAQGHLDRAVGVLDEVLDREPAHGEARSLRERFDEQRRLARTGPARPSDVPQPRTTGGAPAAVTRSGAYEDLNDDSPRRGGPASRDSRSRTEGFLANEGAASSATPRPRENGLPTTLRGGEIQTVAAGSRQERSPGAAGEVARALADEEAPLPERYGVDEIVAIAVDPRSIYLYWEIQPTTLARARARHPEGSLQLRVVSVEPSWDGPVVSIRDVAISALFGDLFVRDVEPGSNVRVSVGWLTNGEFEPLAVGAELSAPRSAPVELIGHLVGQWSPDPIRSPPGRLPDARVAGPASEPHRYRAEGSGPAVENKITALEDEDRPAFGEPQEAHRRVPHAPLIMSTPARTSRMITRPAGASELTREALWEEERRQGVRALGWGGSS